ncbi:MAG: hypothetical protein ACR2FN_13715 [Chitinophagaceae bacterium]
MKWKIFYWLILNFILIAITKSLFAQQTNFANKTLVNLNHLNHLYTPIIFEEGTKAGGIYIYSEAPDYRLTDAANEGFTCVDDVARAALIYLRSSTFFADTAIQSKAINLLKFIVKMQSSNGYFYNFLFKKGSINKTGATSINCADWWSWRALQTLTEAEPCVKNIDLELYNKIDVAINKLIAQIKIDFVNLPQTTKIVNGIIVPTWLPAGSGTDQSAVLIISLISYCTTHNDNAIKNYIRKLAEGILLMQVGDATHFPYNSFLSWENTWHAYGNIQAYALMRAGIFLNDSQYMKKAMEEVDNFYPWLLKNGFISSFTIDKKKNVFKIIRQKKYDQIAYDIEPMFFAAAEAYKLTKKKKYADIAGSLAAWLFGENDANVKMYNINTGICFDGIKSPKVINKNSGAESTIEALLILQQVENCAAIKLALNKYRKP